MKDKDPQTQENRFPNTKGTYILLLIVKKETEIKIGSLGLKKFESGNYVYVGSALGPGGLKARIKRHLKNNKKKRWHIDYLTTHKEIVIDSVYFTESSTKLECTLSKKILELGGEIAVNGFGSSDCNCPSHLIKVSKDIVKKIKDICEEYSKNICKQINIKSLKFENSRDGVT